MSSNNTKNKSGEKGKKTRHAHVNRHNNMGNGGKANTNHPVIPAAAGGRDRKESEMSEVEEGTMCQVCMNTIKVWSVGECNHVICMICSTRMRVLCQRNECAICRQDMPKVIFTTAMQRYENIKDNIYPMDRKYKICFETEEIQNSYTELLEHECPKCPEKVLFKTFQQLDKHLRREHEMYYCDLCVTELKIFTGERKCYNRKDLVRHRREGDPDDSSFKGHPLCEFCDERFYDSEALFKHLRKDHYFCHFCDADGFQYFYADYADLRGHFDRDHFLCKEPECEEKKFIVFRTELDLKAHRLDMHGGLMSKAASKEARKVELNFNFGDRRDRDEDRGGGRGRDRGGGGRERRDRDRDRRDREEAHTAAPEYHDQLDGPVRGAAAVPDQTPDLVSDFPSLSGAPAKVKAPASKDQPQSWSNRSGAATATAEEFPSLPGSRPVPSSSGPVKPYKKPEPKNKTQSAANTNKPRTEDFPSLPVSAPIPRNTSKPATVIKTPFNKKPSPAPQPQPRPSPTKSNVKSGKSRPGYDDDSDDDYPSLGGGPSLNLNYSSNKTVANSGQDLGYTSASVSSNIRTVDRSVLEAMNAPKTNNSSKPSVSSTSDFPGLGRPQQTLDFTTAKKGKKNKKGNQNNNDLSYANKSKEDNKDDKSGKSLNSICDFLGGGATVKVTETKPKPKKEAAVKPIVSKPAEEEVYRPSKNKTTTINNNFEQSKPTQKAVESNGGDDFPSLGKAAKKLTKNFVSAEEKMVQKKSVFTKWGNTVSQAEQSLQNTHIGITGTQKNKVNGKKSKSSHNHKYIAPSNFTERNSGLITSITDLIGIKSLEFKQFKDISGKYRIGQLDSDVYYVQCRELLEEKNFRKVFPELLALLPDIEKQQQLYQLYKQDQWFANDCASECDNCRQICLRKDLDSHLKSCQEEDFPSLS